MAKTDITVTPAPAATVHALKPPAGPEAFEHMQFRQGEFWRDIPAYKDVDEKMFMDWLWQSKNSVKSPDELMATIQGLSSLKTCAKDSIARRWPYASRRT